AALRKSDAIRAELAKATTLDTQPRHRVKGYVSRGQGHLMVIIHCDDVTTGFAARFPSKELMTKYLAFLHEVLPLSAEYIEKASNWK
ncbi:hypothetical protein QCD78_11500, partial [Pseudomonas syringae pv. actinidiae]